MLLRHIMSWLSCYSMMMMIIGNGVNEMGEKKSEHKNDKMMEEVKKFSVLLYTYLNCTLKFLTDLFRSTLNERESLHCRTNDS